jgi:cyclophilin family peptidyl-prolyl cis-trans isomerase
MARGTKRWQAAVWSCAAGTLVVCGALAGCGGRSQPKEVEDGGSTKPVAQNSAPATKPAPGPDRPPQDDQHKPFAEAARAGEDPPADTQVAPDQTVAGKSVGKLYTDVVRTWDSIRYVNAKGERIDYTAHIETDLGTIIIALRPDIAPNHVRNFIALARLGYYDGLLFERINDEAAEDSTGTALKSIEAGCPLGRGEFATGHLGYWLRPEFPRSEAKVVHEEGTVGACHGADADTACCRFYVTLAPASFLDGNYTIFGKIIGGIEIARTIFARPTIVEDSEAGVRRPKEPVVIRKVTIQEHLSGSSSTSGNPLQ